MARIYQVPSHTRLWLTLAVTFCALPQLLKGPLWQGGLFALVIIIRALVNRQRIALPGRIIRSLLLMGAVALTFYSFGRLYGPEAGVALLVSLFGLKYLEVVSQRDAYVLLVLGFFVCATSLLFSQSPLMFLYVLLCMVLLTACLAGINHSDTRASGMQHLKRAGIIMAQAVPLMLILFVLVPRVAPLWNMQVGNGKARTGMTDSMAPGQISELSESSALAFRVAFDGDMPPPAERYWRGLTLSHFDGRAWQQAIPRGMDEARYLYGGRGPTPDWVDALTAGRGDGTSYAYQVIVEPTQRRWLFAMPVPFVSEGGVSLARDMRLVANNPVSQRQSYQVVSVPAATRRLPLAAEEKALMLSIPDESGRRARGLAQQWRLENPSDAAVVQQALRYFRQQPFHYTLRPPKLVADPIDDFLFRSRKGFCEHYASSFTFLMRAAGIPARVVVGYQGGEQNSLGSHLLVRQYDAHAWSEVWLEGQG
ncbi:transglutaminase, partial [Alcanivorax sp. HI0044]|uniref:transglutaminase family protein n=5 Tax=unclassified Alcanivorax TaxID=2638842 RepID=UPI0007B8AAA2